MAKKIFIMTPFGTVTWASINTPCKVDDGPNGPKKDEYQVRIKLSPDDLAAWQEKMKEIGTGFQFATPRPKLGISVNQETGEVTLMGKSHFQPALFDSKNNKIDGAKVGNGSIVRMNVSIHPYPKGLSLALSQVQVQKLVEYESSGGGSGSSSFGETDGHVGEPTGFGAEPEEPHNASAGVDALGI